jgi:hypothetical protein
MRTQKVNTFSYSLQVIVVCLDFFLASCYIFIRNILYIHVHIYWGSCFTGVFLLIGAQRTRSDSAESKSTHVTMIDELACMKKDTSEAKAAYRDQKYNRRKMSATSHTLVTP